MSGLRDSTMSACLCAVVIVNGMSGADSIAQAQPTTAAQQNASIELTGASEFLGAPGKFSLLFLPDGRFHFEIRSEIPIVQTFDGETLWERDWNGVALNPPPPL